MTLGVFSYAYYRREHLILWSGDFYDQSLRFNRIKKELEEEAEKDNRDT